MQNRMDHPCKKICVKTLIMPDGTRLNQQVLMFDSNENVVSIHPLEAEEPFCEWFRGEWKLNNKDWLLTDK